MGIKDILIQDDQMENQLKFTNKKELFNKKIELPGDSGIYQFYDE